MPSNAEPTSARDTPGRAGRGSDPQIRAALDVLFADGLVAFPTETVWGLGACVESEAACERMRAFKGRDADRPVSILVADPRDLDDLGAELSGSARALVREFWPGPLTLVVRCKRSFAGGIASGAGTIGIRCSTHATASSLARAALDCGLGPISATSLNVSGRPPARDRAEALALCAANPSAMVLDGECGGAAPSTVVDASGPRLRILREGAIPEAAIRDCESRARAEEESRTR